MSRQNYQSWGLFEQRERMRKESFINRHAVIHEIWEDMCRLEIGLKPDGTPMLSPWLHCAAIFRGYGRESLPIAPGQAVRMTCQGGDIRQATVTPWAENKEFPAPDHANQVGYTGRTWQNGKSRASDVSGVQEWWISSENSQGGQQSPGSPKIMQRLNDAKGATGRYMDSRYMAAKDGAKIKKSNSHYFVAYKSGLIISEPPVLGADPLPDDNGSITGGNRNRRKRQSRAGKAVK